MPRSKEDQKKYDADYYQRNKNKIKARKVCWVRTLLCKRCLNSCYELPRELGTYLTPDRILDVQVLLTFQ